MNNEIGRKLTSLTLMTIMLAGGMVIAAPSMMPAASAANQTLFVSAENSEFGNVFSGPTVVEIVVSDPTIQSIDDAHGAPDVTVNGNDVVLAQGTDGSWYAYVADQTYANVANTVEWGSGNGLHFGNQCTAATAATATTSSFASFAGAESVYFASSTTTDGTGGNVDGTEGTCVMGTAGVAAYATTSNVPRDAKSLANNSGTAQGIGQIKLVDADYWPIIQTYDFTAGADVVIEYNKAGTNEVSTLKFDASSPYQEFDRTTVPDNAQIFLTIGDPSLNVDPTSSDKWIFDFDGTAYYMDGVSATAVTTADLNFEEGDLIIDQDGTGSVEILDTQANADFASTIMAAGSQIGIVETGANTSVFTSGDATDTSTLFVSASALRGNAGFVDYSGAQSILMNPFWGELNLDEAAVGDEWNSGELIPVSLIDEDFNLNTLSDEDFSVNSTTYTVIPAIQVGSPIMINTTGADIAIEGTSNTFSGVDSYSHIARLTVASDLTVATPVAFKIGTGFTGADYNAIATSGASVHEYLSYDVRSLIAALAGTNTITVDIGGSGATQEVASGTTIAATGTGLTSLGTAMGADLTSSTNEVVITFNIVTTSTTLAAGTYPIAADIFSYGDTVNNAIYRMELEESGDNTGEFTGDIEYIMVNQINFASGTIPTTVANVDQFDNNIVMIVTGMMTDEDGIRVNYYDLGADGISTQIADQQDAPTHSGVADLDMDNYKIADTVYITITDMDLNTDTELIDIYQVQSDDADQGTNDTVLFSVTFDDAEWKDLDAASEGVTLVETDATSGIFTASFQVPSTFDNAGSTVTTTGTDIEVNYMDHRDSSGNSIEVGDGAGIRANTGSISLDRTVYPVPWGDRDNFASISSGKTPNSFSIFPIHATGISGTIDTDAEQLNAGDGGAVVIHVRVSDADLDTAAAGQDKMQVDTSNSVGPVKITVTRGTETMTLGYAGGSTASTTKYIVPTSDSAYAARTMGPMTEVAGDAGGVFELDFTINYTDGPDSAICPTTTTFESLDADVATTETDRFSAASASGQNYCILQGDILTVEYSDNVDASGNNNTATDSATFDLRNGVLQSDKSVYIIGSDMILTIIEPDWDLDNDGAQSYDIDVVEWDSSAQTTTIGSTAAFDPEPSKFRETGDSTGIFQVVIEVPSTLDSTLLDRGESITLEYTDWGPAGSKYVGQEDEDMSVQAYTSNFGATVELDQKVYTWTDVVYITIVAPDHNFDSNLIDNIGNTDDDPIKVSTRAYDINKYKLVETGTDTGIFTGEVTLTGFSFEADGTNTHTPTSTSADSTGPTNGSLETASDDGLTVSFEFSSDDTVVGSALIRWNIGEVQWLESSYPASGTGIVRIIDPDMNLNPSSVDNFKVPTWSDSDAGGINLTVTETNEATGIFEGTVFFTTTDASSGHRLRVAEGDTVTTEYTDHTLPAPYTNADDMAVAATTLIGTVVPPLERAPAANLRTVDAFGNSLNAVSVDQQVQLTADLANGQDKDQAFAYLVQVQDGNGVTVSLAWITGSLSAGQSFSPALSWIPTEAGSYTATAFVWESVDNPTALSPSVSTTVDVN